MAAQHWNLPNLLTNTLWCSTWALRWQGEAAPRAGARRARGQWRLLREALKMWEMDMESSGRGAAAPPALASSVNAAKGESEA